MTDSRLALVEWTFQQQPGRVAVRLWGAQAPARPAVVCVHGLSRNARDFDELAQALSARFRVACIDMPGRGDSTWLADPAGYTQDHYLRIARHVIDARVKPNSRTQRTRRIRRERKRNPTKGVHNRPP